MEKDKVYIIGGIVDRNRLKGITFSKAVKQDIATARFPIDAHHLKTAGPLTVNHTYDILLKYGEKGNWEDAFQESLPKRPRFNIRPPEPTVANKTGAADAAEEPGAGTAAAAATAAGAGAEAESSSSMCIM